MCSLLFYTFVVWKCLTTGDVLAQNYSRREIQKLFPGFGDEWIAMDEDDKGNPIIGYFDIPPIKGRISLVPEPREVVTFTLFTRKNTVGTRIDSIKGQEQIFDKTKPTKFVTHGWLNSGTSETCLQIKDGFLKKYDANVFIVDWGKIASIIFYPLVVEATKPVGRFYAAFLNELISHGVDPLDIHLVGHSLGAHTSGFAARGVKSGKIGRVTGLDPAGPGFSIDNPDGRLRKQDATFVDVIHTCAGLLGIAEPIGHADFFPNGGTAPQPGCGGLLERIEGCSHGRSTVYFGASLAFPVPFTSYSCNSFNSFEKHGCKGKIVPMGDSAPANARGNFYLKTQADAPYALKFQLDIDVGNVLDS